MALVHFTVRVTEERLLEPPHEMQAELHPGQEIDIQCNYPPVVTPGRNEKMLSLLKQIEARHKERPETDGFLTQKLINEAREGANL